MAHHPFHPSKHHSSYSASQRAGFLRGVWTIGARTTDAAFLDGEGGSWRHEAHQNDVKNAAHDQIAEVELELVPEIGPALTDLSHCCTRCAKHDTAH